MSEIAAKLTTVAKEIGAFAADKRNEQQRYDYISADQVLTRVGEAMAKHQLAVVPSVHEVNVNPVEYKTNGIRYDVMAVMQMDILAGDESATRPWVGMGSDYTSPDKALSKAITTGHKYFLMKLFNIGVGNPDGEHDEPPRRKKQRPAAAPATPVQRQSPPPQQASNGKAERKPGMFLEGDAVSVKGQHDEKPGTITEGPLPDGRYKVKVDGKTATVSPSRLTLVPAANGEPQQGALPVQGGGGAYEE